MSQDRYRYVVLGGGNGAGYVARAFAELGCQGMLRIISEEKTLPYERAALSKKLTKLGDDVSAESKSKQKDDRYLIASQDKRWYQEQDFDIRLNTCVSSVDLEQKILHTTSGDFRFQKLIVATGSKLHTVRIAGANLGEVYCLRAYDHKLNIMEAIATAKHGGRVKPAIVVVGSNYIAMESAASLAEAGVDTTVVLEADQFLPDLFLPQLSEQFEQLLQRENVRVIKGLKVEELLPRENADDMVGFVRLENGEQLPCSFCVLVPGTMPRVGLFRGLLDICQKSGGLLVDSHLRTSHRDVYAIGDVCAFPQFYDGQPGRWPRADHAARSAHYVAHSILADENNSAQQLEDYWYLPHTSSIVFGRAWDFLGRPYGECFMVGTLSNRQSGFAAVYVSPENRIEGIFLENGSCADLELLREVAYRRCHISQEQLLTLRAIDSAQTLLQFLSTLFTIDQPQTTKQQGLHEVPQNKQQQHAQQQQESQTV